MSDQIPKVETETNPSKSSNKKIIYITVAIGLTILLITLAIFIFNNQNQGKQNNEVQIQNNQTNQNVSSQESEKESILDKPLMWRQGANGYEKIGEVPECEEPLVFDSPVDISAATSILYPGQPRGGNYKPHGGFRFDNNTTNEIDIVAPFDGYLVQGARYLSEGEIQYTFDVIHPCGIMYRLGHLRVLTPKFEAIAESFPEATEDSRTTFINPPVKVFKGEVFATKIGIIGTSNPFFDFGVFDLRQKNEASKEANYANKSQNNQLALFAICWLDNLDKEESDYIYTLPAGDPTSGKNSDYCN